MAPLRILLMHYDLVKLTLFLLTCICRRRDQTGSMVPGMRWNTLLKLICLTELFSEDKL